ncbi:MAG: hypothetical protein WAM21_06220 [Steroidobacteraceae bacterium]
MIVLQPRITKIAAVVLRVSAALSAIASSSIVLMVGIMANDSGTPAGERASAIVLIVGAITILWTLLCSIAPQAVSPWLPWAPVRFLLIHVPVLIFGLGGVAWIAAWGYSKLGLGTHFSQEVRRTERAYPVANPTPSHWLEIHGTLPATVPVDAVEETFMTTVAPGQAQANTCQRRSAPGLTVPIMKHETVPVRPENGRYEIRLPVDRYLPGKCGWQLRFVDFQLFVTKSGARRSNAQVAVPTEQEEAVTGNTNLYQGRLDLWCGEALNKQVTPYYPVVCGNWDTMFDRIPPEERNLIAPQETDSHETTWVLPGTHSIEINFHDADAPGRFPANPADVAAARTCESNDFMAWFHRAASADRTLTSQNAQLREFAMRCNAAQHLPSWMSEF